MLQPPPWQSGYDFAKSFAQSHACLVGPCNLWVLSPQATHTARRRRSLGSHHSSILRQIGKSAHNVFYQEPATPVPTVFSQSVFIHNLRNVASAKTILSLVPTSRRARILSQLLSAQCHPAFIERCPVRRGVPQPGPRGQISPQAAAPRIPVSRPSFSRGPPGMAMHVSTTWHGTDLANGTCGYASPE